MNRLDADRLGDDFDDLDATMRALNDEALATIAERIDVVARLELVMRDVTERPDSTRTSLPSVPADPGVVDALAAGPADDGSWLDDVGPVAPSLSTDRVLDALAGDPADDRSWLDDVGGPVAPSLPTDRDWFHPTSRLSPDDVDDPTDFPDPTDLF